MPEIVIQHSEIEDPNKITDEMIKRFKEKELDIHRHEVTDIEDDYSKGIRRIKIKNTKYFFMSK